MMFSCSAWNTEQGSWLLKISMLHLATRVLYVLFRHLCQREDETRARGNSAKSGIDLLWVFRVFFRDFGKRGNKHVGYIVLSRTFLFFSLPRFSTLSFRFVICNSVTSALSNRQIRLVSYSQNRLFYCPCRRVGGPCHQGQALRVRAIVGRIC